MKLLWDSWQTDFFFSSCRYYLQYFHHSVVKIYYTDWALGWSSRQWIKSDHLSHRNCIYTFSAAYRNINKITDVKAWVHISDFIAFGMIWGWREVERERGSPMTSFCVFFFLCCRHKCTLLVLFYKKKNQCIIVRFQCWLP